MEWWQTISLALVFIGGLNWLLVGLFRFDLVAAVAGGMGFGQTNAFSRIVYVILGPGSYNHLFLGGTAQV